MQGIPTVDETGVPGLYMPGWFGFFAPKGTPKEVVARLNGAMMQALADPAVRARFTDLGLDVARASNRRRRAGRLPQGRDREVVADHQGRRHHARQLANRGPRRPHLGNGRGFVPWARRRFLPDDVAHLLPRRLGR